MVVCRGRSVRNRSVSRMLRQTLASRSCRCPADSPPGRSPFGIARESVFQRCCRCRLLNRRVPNGIPQAWMFRVCRTGREAAKTVLWECRDDFRTVSGGPHDVAVRAGSSGHAVAVGIARVGRPEVRADGSWRNGFRPALQIASVGKNLVSGPDSFPHVF